MSNALTGSPPSTTVDFRVPLVLLAGMNCTPDLWTGCGLDGAITPSLDEADIDDQVDALLDKLPQRFALAGLSLGAIVAMALTRRAPQRVSRLCLMSTNAKAPMDAQRQGWQAWRERLAAGESARDLQHGILEALASAPALHRDPHLAGRVLRMGDDTGTARLDAQLRLQATRVDESAALADLRMPVLVVSGAADVICPPSFHRDIAGRIPGAQLVSLDAGHLAPMERPAEIGRLLRGWLES